MKILLGITGSVAATVADKIVSALKELGEVVVVSTEIEEKFYPYEFVGVKRYGDRDEWKENDVVPKWEKGDPVLHVDLGRDADILVIAPVTTNTMAKMANGIADNLLSCVYAAWGQEKPVVIAPAMNTNMWFSKANQRNLKTLLYDNVKVVYPVEKMLACGVMGMGAMADVKEIARMVSTVMSLNDGGKEVETDGGIRYGRF